MNDLRDLGGTLAHAATTLLERLVAYLPNILAAALLLLAGWVLAIAMRAITARAVLLVDTMLPRLGLPSGISRLRAARGSVVAGTVVFWVVLLFFVTAATQALGLQAFTDWLAKLIDYLPTLAVGLLILAAGWLLSGFAADLVQATVSRLEPGQRAMLARIVRVAILAGAILIGADQIGIRITFLAIIAAAVFLAVAGGAAIAASLGARSYVANLIGGHALRQAFEVGQRVRVAGHEGRILELNATGMVVETSDGRVTLPGRLYHDEPIVLLTKTGGDG
jgi:small-conductance mechanosensitive channel